MATWHFVYAKRLAFYPPDYDSPGLGGSESVLVVLTRALARRGHKVTVYNCAYRPGVYDDVSWRPIYELPDAEDPNIRVAVRYEESIVPSTRAQSIFWMLDNRPEGAYSFRQALGHDAPVVVASRAMQKLTTEHGVNGDVREIPLPIETSLYASAPDRPRRPICLYASIPDRGLDVALALWPQIRAAVPDAELHVTGGYRLWGLNRAEAAVLDKRARTSDVDGIQYFGVLNRADLRSVQEQAALMLYPCREQEMFCLAVAEAAAAGTPAVTSNSYALAERVDDGRTGILIEGSIDEPSIQQRFADETVALLTNPRRCNELGRAAQHDASQLDSDHIAAHWERLIPC